MNYDNLLQIFRGLIKSEIYEKLKMLLNLIAAQIKAGLKADHYFTARISHNLTPTPPPPTKYLSEPQMTTNLFWEN